MEFKITKKQLAFIRSTCDETLFGGAAGGGKSYAQLIDAFIYALTYKKSKQLMLRRTFPELRRSLILVSLTMYPKSICRYYETIHKWIFSNGSSVEFGFCDSESDVTRYQSAEYDVIRFDELTHFTKFQFTYLLSRLRGANDYPKYVKSTTNPGGVGHDWVKSRYIDPMPPLNIFDTGNNTRIFIPAKVEENTFLMKSDPMYIDRLRQLDEKNQKALLDGSWDIFEGQFFSQFNRNLHVIKPFVIPQAYQRYLTIDYGLDMLAALWIATDDKGNAYVYRELYQSGLIISDAAKRIISLEQDENIYRRLAPPDLWNRRQETGRSAIDIFEDLGLSFDKTSNDRVHGWLSLLEYLKAVKNEQGMFETRLKIFENCSNLIRTLPALRHDEKNPNDVANTPHELTHAPDALRGFAVTIFGDEVSKTIDASDNFEEITDFLMFK